jgi:undecaprenyl-diphosphatase
MGIISWLSQFDMDFFLTINRANSPYFDAFFSLFTSREIWYPFYLVLIVLFVRRYKKHSIPLILLVLLAILLADQSSNLLKNTIERLRPSHEPLLGQQVHLTFVGAGGNYGFPSGHATNAFALLVFIGHLFRRRDIVLIMSAWALLTIYSRIYVGVHYPFDVLCGSILGALIGWGAYRFLVFADIRFLRKEILKNSNWKPKQYSSLLLAMAIIFLTIIVVSYLMLKYKIIN